VLASSSVTDSGNSSSRGLIVLADGVHAAFAAGAVAELARRGARWDRGAGAGLGAHVALLGLLGEAAEAERRWLREGALGSPMFESRLGAARRRIGDVQSVTVLLDPWSLPGWLDPAGLGEHLAPEMADVPQRLTRRCASLRVAVEDMRSGTRAWFDLAAVPPKRAGTLLRAAAAFPGGWGPEIAREGEAVEVLWGGIAPALQGAAPWEADESDWDLVCGFPVPAGPRPALAGSLIELIQRRSEITGAARVSAWRKDRRTSRPRVVAPAGAGYRRWAGRESADLGVEYPLPWERNGELTAGLVRYGASAAAESDGPPVG